MNSLTGRGFSNAYPAPPGVIIDHDNICYNLEISNSHPKESIEIKNYSSKVNVLLSARHVPDCQV